MDYYYPLSVCDLSLDHDHHPWDLCHPLCTSSHSRPHFECPIVQKPPFKRSCFDSEMFRSKPRYDPEAFLAESPDRANRRGRQLIDNMNAFRETLQDRNADNLHFIHNQNIPSAIPPERLNALRREKPVMPASARRSGRHARAPSAEGVDELVQHLRDMDLNISQLQMLVDREVELWRLHPDKVSTYLNALNSVLEAQRNSNAEPEKCSADVPIPSEAANRREHYGRVGVPPSAHKHTSPEILHELHEHETDRKPVPIRTTGVQQPVAGSSQQAMVEAWEYEQTLFEFNAQMGAAAPQRLQQQTAIQDMLAAQAFSTENPNAELAQDRDSQYSEVTAASSFSRSHRDSKHESQDQDNFAARIMSGLFGDAPSVQKTLSELRDMLVNHPAAPHSRSDHLAPRAPASLAPSSEVRGSHENQVDIHGAVLSDEELATEEHIRDLLSSSQYDRQEKSRTSGLRRKSLALTEVGKKVAHGLSNMARSLRSRHKSMKLKAEASHDGAALAINSTDDVQSKREGKRPVRQTSSREAPASLLSPHDEDKLIREVLEQQRLMAAAAARALKDFQGSFLTECVCCGDEKNTGLSFPSRPPTDACEHAPKTCLECLDCWLASELAGKGCKALRCPDCLKEMEYEDVRRGASEKTREGYDGRLFLMALSEEPEFAWCLAPNCNSGQLNEDNENYMECASCQYQQCLKHKIPWHRGETCEVYEQRVKFVDECELATQAMINGVSQICIGEGCGWRIQKRDGCDHMTCTRCGSQFCYQCRADHKEIRRVGNSAHATYCKFHSGNLNVSWPFNAHA